MTPKSKRLFDRKPSLAMVSEGWTKTDYETHKRIFSQGDGAHAILYIQNGKVKLTVVSQEGKEAVIALLGNGDFFGEGCLVGQQRRMATATTMSDCTIMRLDKAEMTRLLQMEPAFSEMFLQYLLTRNIRIEEDLVDQLFNSSEKRLARTLLLLANYGKEGQQETVIPKISQETLAEIVGTTRSRVSFFMNRFRKLGFIEYNGTVKVHNSLHHVILHD
jgi:CRP-like cAMP-binding protein